MSLNSGSSSRKILFILFTEPGMRVGQEYQADIPELLSEGTFILCYLFFITTIIILCNESFLKAVISGYILPCGVAWRRFKKPGQRILPAGIARSFANCKLNLN